MGVEQQDDCPKAVKGEESGEKPRPVGGGEADRGLGKAEALQGPFRGSGQGIEPRGRNRRLPRGDEQGQGRGMLRKPRKRYSNGVRRGLGHG
jgi:hypothetical protein